jgi:hypothetical protein
MSSPPPTRGIKLNPKQAEVNRAKAAEQVQALRPHIERCIEADRTSEQCDRDRCAASRHRWQPMVSNAGASCPSSPSRSMPASARSALRAR